MKTEPVKEEEKKKKKRNPEQIERVKEEEEEKRRRTEQPTQEKKGKKKKKSKGTVEHCLWVPHMCVITILSLSYELWKLKTAKMCFQFP